MAWMSRLEREMDALQRSLAGAFAPGWRRPMQTGSEECTVNIYETPEEYFVRTEVPGADRNAFNINISGGVLNMQGKYREVKEEGDPLRLERPRGNFYRSLNVSRYADPDKVEANYRDGVLEVRIAKTKEALPRQITVKA